MYRSMLGEDAKTPSFNVDDRIGTWFDHCIGKGGNIMDFGLVYWPGLAFSAVLEKLYAPGPVLLKIVHDHRPRRPIKVRNYVVKTVKPLGIHIAIANYLESRGVFDVAKGRLSESIIMCRTKWGQRKPFFAGGWEVRNKCFKGYLSTKAITLVTGDQKQAVVFEGYINYLSWLA